MLVWWSSALSRFVSTTRPLKAWRGCTFYSHHQFPRDTIAAIFTSGLLGEQFVGLEAGGDSVMLKDEERIKKTQSAVQLEN